MAQSVAPIFSKNRVNAAGRRARQEASTVEDMEVIENWRASHAHVLNAFQTTLRNKNDGAAQIVQRLKRMPTILDKLKRRPKFSLSEMQDVAGCRLIFDDIESLYDFRERFLRSRISHPHLSLGSRYDYIISPKEDGYRGLHEVFSYKSRKAAGAPWAGLRVEIQFRTSAQHAWATAVEVAGFLTKNDPKFGRGSREYLSFFQLTSEVLARRCEGHTGPLPRMPYSEIEKRLAEIVEYTKIIQIFERFNEFEERPLATIGKSVFMIVKRLDDAYSRPQVLNFDSFADALRDVGKFERPEPGQGRYDVVVVRDVSNAMIGNAYRNYFSDTREFVRLIRENVSVEL